MHLLSVILTKATGMPTSQNAQQVLFTPLGITSYKWEALRDGYINGGAGLELTARDFAKLAVLWQQDGVWQSKRVLPAGWQSLAATSMQNPGRKLSGLGFKWLWLWLVADSIRKSWLASAVGLGVGWSIRSNNS